MRKRRIFTKNTLLTLFLPGLLIVFISAGLRAQQYQLINEKPPVIHATTNDVNIRFLPNNQVEYYIAQGRWAGWSIAYEWGRPQVTYLEDGQLLSINTRGWVVGQGPPQRGATISISVVGLTNGNRFLSDGRAYAGYSSSLGRSVNNNGVGQVKMTQWDESDIVVSVQLNDGGGTSVTLATYTFRRMGSGPTPASLPTPVLEHNIVYNNEYWMSIKPSGLLSGLQGKDVQLVARFYHQDARPLYANPQEQTYKDANGLVACATNVAKGEPSFDLTQQVMYIPYRALNLPNTGGQTTYNLFLFVDLFVDGQLKNQSGRVAFSVKW